MDGINVLEKTRKVISNEYTKFRTHIVHRTVFFIADIES